MKKYLNQTGDTILEVLLAMVVAVAVLTGAYVSSRASTNATIRSREHDQGVKLAQAQLEQLRSAVDLVKSKTKLFCINASAGTITAYDFASNNEPETLVESDYPTNCKVDGIGSPYGAGSEGAKYQVAIKRKPNGSSDDNLYKVSVRWNKAGGGTDQLTFLYRVYQ